MKSIKLSLIAASNLALLFLLQWLPVSIIGTGLSTDILFAALIVPQVIAAIFSSNLMQVLIPVLVEEKDSVNNGIFGSIAIIICIAFVFFYSLLAYSIPQLTHLIYPNYDAAIQHSISRLIQFALVGSFFTTMVATYSAAYYTQNKAFLIELFGSLSSLVALSYMAMTLSEEDLGSAIWAINFRWIICFILLYSFSKSKKINAHYKNALKKICIRLKTLILGSFIYKTDIIVDRYFSAQAMSGDLTILHIVQQVFSAISALLNRVLLTPSSPKLATLNSEKHQEDFRNLFQNIIKKVLFLNLLCFFGLILAYLLSNLLPEIKIANTPINEWLYVSLLTSGVIFGGTLGGVFSVRYYSQGNTSIPTKVGLFGFANGCLLKFSAFSLFGFTGLLFAISGYYLITVGTFYILYRKESLITQTIQ